MEENMKTKITIEIETKDVQTNIFPEEGKVEELDYDPKELADFQKSFPADVNKSIVADIENYVEEHLEEHWLDNLEELSIEGWESFDDYDVKIKVTTETEEESKEDVPAN
jgi:hypothetical protein